MPLIVNPFATVKPADAERRALIVRAPVRGGSLRVTTIGRHTEPGLFSLLLVQAATGNPQFVEEISSDERARLVETGFLVADDQVSRRVTYACDVDDPSWTTDPAAGSVDGLRVDPSLQMLGTDGPSKAMRGRVDLPNPFRPGRAWLRVQPSPLQIPSFYSWDPERTPELNALQAGEPVPAAVGTELRARLVDAGIIGRPDAREAAHAALASTVSQLDRDRYVMLRQTTAPRQRAAVQHYYRSLINEGFLVFGDSDWPHRYMARYDPVAHFFHEQWTELASAIAGQPLKASFPFFTSYHAGADLGAHKDREQCTFSISVQLDHEPEPAGDAPWPIYLQPGGPETAFPVTMAVGDAVMFYGQEILHYRHALPEGRSSYWFLFYVPVSFDGPLD